MYIYITGAFGIDSTSNTTTRAGHNLLFENFVDSDTRSARDSIRLSRVEDYLFPPSDSSSLPRRTAVPTRCAPVTLLHFTVRSKKERDRQTQEAKARARALAHRETLKFFRRAIGRDDDALERHRQNTELCLPRATSIGISFAYRLYGSYYHRRARRVYHSIRRRRFVVPNASCFFRNSLRGRAGVRALPSSRSLCMINSLSLHYTFGVISDDAERTTTTTSSRSTPVSPGANRGSSV